LAEEVRGVVLEIGEDRGRFIERLLLRLIDFDLEVIEDLNFLFAITCTPS
jgi:hypothetical protein